MTPKIFLSKSEKQTRQIAARWGKRLKPLDVVCLYGPMGSGKTTFAQGIAQGLGFRGRAVSPTFNLIREYRIKEGILYHLDLFRIDSSDLNQLGLEDYFSDPYGICVIEWPECAVGWLPKDRLEVYFSFAGFSNRKIRFS
ncbi:MAG: tRNA (adenosine(37)-N6)-threonylcarbamoyltransferase complex ATPase subunit type 1 TsaE [Elusimicrobia bacterium]|nr:tRNA (adenosine(37)-N6)-threonylcarbamoyltransferase complex ATPase subunit type 1 TsaE [Elusimicrobiota bacterium]